MRRAVQRAVPAQLPAANAKLAGYHSTPCFADLNLLLQGVVTPATIVTACSAALAPLYNWLLVDKFRIGLAGAALANDAVQVSCSTSLANTKS